MRLLHTFSSEKEAHTFAAFLKKEGVQEKVQIVPINDDYGITLDNREIDAIVVSQETAKHALEINELRTKRGLQPLTVTVIAMVLAEDNIPISTTRVKCGEIDRYGHLL